MCYKLNKSNNVAEDIYEDIETGNIVKKRHLKKCT